MAYNDEQFQRRERLLVDTAHALFRVHGWEAVTVAQVAREAGIGKATVYRHFPSKEAIYAYIALDFSRDCLEHYRAVDLEPSPLTALGQIIRLAFDRMRENPTELQLCLHCERPEFRQRLNGATRDAFLQLEKQYHELFSSILNAAVRKGELSEKPLQPLYWGVDAVFQGVMAHIARGGLDQSRYQAVDLERYLDHVTEFILAGIVGTPPPGSDEPK